MLTPGPSGLPDARLQDATADTARVTPAGAGLSVLRLAVGEGAVEASAQGMLHAKATPVAIAARYSTAGPPQLLPIPPAPCPMEAKRTFDETGFPGHAYSEAACPPQARADEDAFVQIGINLVDNALKFSANAEVRRIDMGWCCHASQPQRAVFFVRDYGPGVAHDQRQRIFQLFYRAENELTRQTKGTGIGLALVAALATKMQAQVYLHNHTPGAEFQLVMPMIEGA